MTTYQVKNLDCAECAARIEKRINSMTTVRYASLSFASASLTIDTDDMEAVREEIRRLEPEVEISAPGGGIPEGEEARERTRNRREVLAILLFAALYGTAFGAGRALGPALFIAVWLAAGFRVLRAAAGSLRHGRVFDENFLMTVATAGALTIGAFSEAAGVMLFYRFGEFLEELSLARSRRSIKALLALKADYAEVLREGKTLRVDPEEVRAGETVLVRPGARIPLDGVVLEGSSWVDTAAVTGEPVPREAAPGSQVLGGTVNGLGLLSVRVVREYGESTAARILRLVEEASARKSRTERFMTRFAGYYTPAVLAVALLTAVLPPLLLPGQAFRDWLYRALTILVISCPCALVVSIPLGYFGGIGAAARRGILIKGSNFIDVLARVDTVVFDKTGTLTRGNFAVLGVHPAGEGEREREAPDGTPASGPRGNGWSAPGLLELAARADAGSNHPIARSLRAAHGQELSPPSVFREVPGMGIRAEVEGRLVLAGSAEFLRQEGVSVPEDLPAPPAGSGEVHIAADGFYAGRIDLGDQVRPESARAVEALTGRGIRVVMLSGDEEGRAREVGRSLGIDDARGGLFPEDKALHLAEIRKESAGAVAFVGDGINDAPVLAGADAGIAMGGIGQDAAVETADIVILDDDPRKIPDALTLAGRTRVIVLQNILFALAVKALFMAGGIAGLAGMWEAVFADVGVAVLAVLNSMRTMRMPGKA